MNIYKKLSEVQKELKAPKNQYNSFGKYNYRSCEDILEAVKPLCIEKGLIVTVSDEIEVKQDRYYVKAVATVIDIDTEQEYQVSAYARESDNKKGMDDSQVTGATSSYARKYALNGMFAIDDTKDADTDAHKNQTNQTKKTGKLKTDLATESQLKMLRDLLKRHNISEQDICKQKKINKLEDMKREIASKAIKYFSDMKEEK